MLKTAVVVCTRNRCADVLTFLTTLEQQTVQPTEIIVVDSSDAPLSNQEAFTAHFTADRFAQSTLRYDHMQPGLTAQRNRAVTLSQADVLYFFDDDILLGKTYLAEMNRIFSQHPEYGGGMGSVQNMVVKHATWHRWFRAFFLLQRDYASGCFTASGMPTHAYGRGDFCHVQVLGGCCMAYRKTVFKKHLFDESLQRYAFMEDCDFSYRVSRDFQLFYNPRAQLQHTNSPLDRDSLLENRAMYIKNYSYLFFKNVYPKYRLALFAYCWSIIGLFVEALLMRDLRYVRGYWRGMISYYF